MFRKLYERLLQLARTPAATPVLGVVAFTESIIFPIPPDALMIPMMFAQTKKESKTRAKNIWWLAAFTTFCSVAGAAGAYILGAAAWDAISPAVFALSGGETNFARFQSAYMEYGVWVVLVAGFSFLPFKLATLASGALGAPFLPFIIAATFGRGARFFTLAALIYFFGRETLHIIEKYSAPVSWIMLAALAIAAYFIFR